MRHNIEVKHYASLNAPVGDTRNTESGIYLYTIKSNGATKTGKIVINH